MTHLIKRVYERIVFTVALVTTGASVGWFWREQAVIRSLHREPIRPVLSGSPYAAMQWPLPQAPGALWSKPPAQSRGSDWLYEVFTPPVIIYNRVAQSFEVASPHTPAKPVAAEPGLQLLSVKLEPYRLQLVGYFGKTGDYQAAFATPHSSETILARPGHRFEPLGLTLKSFDVSKVAVEGGAPGPVYEVAALAVLQDEMAGTEVVLDSRTRKLTDTPLAVFNVAGEADGARELHEGDTFSCDEAVYRVERIHLDPVEVVVARTSPSLPVPEMRALRVGRVTGKEAPPRPFATKASTDVAAANP